MTTCKYIEHGQNFLNTANYVFEVADGLGIKIKFTKLDISNLRMLKTKCRLVYCIFGYTLPRYYLIVLKQSHEVSDFWCMIGISDKFKVAIVHIMTCDVQSEQLVHYYDVCMVLKFYV